MTPAHKVNEAITISSEVEKSPAVTTLEAEIARLEGRQSRWETWLKMSLAAAALAAVGIAVFDFGSRVTGKRLHDRQSELNIVKDREYGADSKAKDLRIAQAGQEAGAANERAGQLEKEAAEAKLETEKLKQVVAWRVIGPQAATELEKILSSKPGSVNLRYTDGDPEALFLAIQVSRILGKAKWQIAPGAEKFANAIEFGIALPDSTGADAQTLRSAFVAARMSFTTNPLPPSGVSFNISTIPGAPTLMIGSRMPVHIP